MLVISSLLRLFKKGTPPRDEGQYSLLYHRLDYHFKNQEFLLQALTHRSFVHERHGLGENNNERLEFLGDAVIDLSVGIQLMTRLPQAREGELSRLRALVVSESSLAICARALDLGPIIKMGKGEEQTGGRDKNSILADAMEAVVGAIYLDSNYERTHQVLTAFLSPLINDAISGLLDCDHKSRLQVIIQANRRIAPCYHVVDEQGPGHAKLFTVAVTVSDKELARGNGHSKKEAEQNAAQLALINIEAELSEDI